VGAYGASGELLGYANYGPTPHTDRTWDLYWIAVAREAHGKGVGSALLAEVERRLKEAGARLLLIETSSRTDYDATRGFYVARGYTEQARIRDFYAPDDDRVMLTKTLYPDAR
jgi:ribosomal protein S18 acetylase RimI-like enzyme